MKRHALHLLMCAPMIVIGVVLVAGGSGLGVFLPIAACVVMMWAMMSMMGGHGRDRG